MRVNLTKYLQIFVLIISFVVFAPALTGNFLNWDDTTYITGNEILNEDVGLKSFLELYDYDAYISLTLFSFQIQTKIFGYDPSYFHLINTLIHLINVFLVFYLAKTLFRNRNTAFWIALIFAVHPYKVESVAWIIQRKDLLYAMFFLSGIIAYIKFIRTDKILWYILTIILAYLAIISKAAAISFVFILILVEYYVKNRIRLKSLVLFFIIGFVQLSHINTVVLNFAFSVIPLLIVRGFNRYSTINIKQDAIKSKPKIISFFSSRKYYLFFFYGFLIVFISSFLVNTTKIILMPDNRFNLSFIFNTIAYFMPVLIFYVFDDKNYDRLSNLIARLLKARKIILIIAIVFVVLISILAYFLAKPHFESAEFSVADIFSFKTVMYFSFSLVYYFFGFLFPFYQNAMHPYPQVGQYGLLLNLSPLILLVLGVVVFYLVKKIKDKSIRTNIIFGLLFFVINIVIVLHIIPIRGRVIVAERYTYLAYLGLIFIIVIFFKNAIANGGPIKKKISYFFMIALIAAYSIQSFSRSEVFKNSYSFWSDVIEKDSDNHYAIFALGLSYFENADYKTAIDKYSAAIALESENCEYYLNRGSSFYKIDSTSLALADYNKAISLCSKDYLAYKNRGIMYYETGNLEQAVADFNACLHINPAEKEISELSATAKQLLIEYNDFNDSGTSSGALSQYFFRLATNYAQKADYQQSLFLFNEALKFDSLNIDAYKNRGNAYAMLNDLDNARNSYAIALRINPTDAGLYINFGNILHQLGDVDAACENWEKAVELGKTEANKMIDQFCK